MRLPIAVTIGVLICQPLGAQIIQGRTMDAASRAWVPATFITLIDEAGDSLEAVLSDEEALFRIAAPGPGPYRLRAERIGYTTITTPVIAVDTYEEVTVELLLGAAPVALDPLTVTSRRYGGRGMIAAHRRRADWIQRTGIGKVITRAEMDLRPRPFVSDYLYTVPGMRVMGSGHDARVSMRGCAPQVFVDGIRAPGLSVNAVSPDALEGIEVYRSLSEIPPELRGIGNCGAIALFTRAGEPSTGEWTLFQKILAGAGATALGVLIFTQF